jgi:hypothetical protein
MSSARWRTPYLPAAQLFYRFTVAVRDSSLAMKLALTACDLLTIVVLWQWLRRTGRNEWLALVYAWHPLVILELAHSAHIDALLVLMLTAAASWLARGRSTLAILAFVMAVMVKPLPVVLAPLFIGHVRGRDLVAGLGLAVALYIPFLSPHELPLGLMPGLVQGLRFNGPIYLLIGWATLPAIAAAVAVGAGLTAAMAARKRWGPSRPESWAWPMAIALALAPMVYPWYLVSLVPFLVARTTLPILAWTLSVLPVYVVWVRAARGGAWSVPPAVLAVEYSVVLLTAVVLWRSRTRLGAQAE